jgi:hypothetical protein
MTTYLARLATLALLFMVASPVWAAPVRLEAVPAGKEAPSWKGAQIVQADRTGNVFFLRGDTLQVYPLRKSGLFGDPVRLETTAEGAGMVRDAALSPAGDQWLILSNRIRYFVRGQEKPVPALDWTPWSVGFLRDTPVVAVIPRPAGRVRDLDRPIDVPWFLKLGSDRWDPVTTLKSVEVAKLGQNGGMNGAIAENAVYLAGDRQGRLWAARQYAYRVQRFGSGGRPLLELDVDGGKVRQKEAGQGIDVKLTGTNINPTEATRNPRTEKATYYSFTAEAVLLDLVEGRDGRMYFLARTSEGQTVLDRYDPTRNLIERIALKIETRGVVNMAAGRDALYIAPWNSDQGRWRIRWDSLEEADWKEVEDARIDGVAPASP